VNNVRLAIRPQGRYSEDARPWVSQIAPLSSLKPRHHRAFGIEAGGAGQGQVADVVIGMPCTTTSTDTNGKSGRLMGLRGDGCD
jgi:hypothetical protein